MPSFPFPVTTTFLPIAVRDTANVKGQAIGQGKCVGVYLYLNNIELNNQAEQQTAASQSQIYYGDSNYQLTELQRGNFSKFLYCQDLSEIYVRGNGSNNVDNLTAIIYTRVEETE